MSYALNRFKSGYSHTQQHIKGRLPYVEHRVVNAEPLIWQPYGVYFVLPPNASSSLQYWVDADGIEHPVGDVAFYEWKSRPGNETKTVSEFVDALVAIASPSGYTHVQAVASNLWTVVHNLGHKPLVQAYDGSGADLGSLDFTHLNNNSLTIAWETATAGEARCA